MTAVGMPDTPEFVAVPQHNFNINLTQLANGKYRWEIKVRGDDMNMVLEELQDIDTRLRKMYGDKTEGKD